MDRKTCHGTGEISQEAADDRKRWLPEGRKLRIWREDQGRSLGEEARRRGISVVALSEMETGRREPEWPEGVDHA